MSTAITTTATVIIMFLFLSGPANIAIIDLSLSKVLSLGQVPHTLIAFSAHAWSSLSIVAKDFACPIMNDAAPKKIAAVKVIVSKGSHVFTYGNI